MSQLIQMRQQIKAIETIKKITHAMRLIAMSAHTRLRAGQATIEEYKKEMEHLFTTVSANSPEWVNPLIDIPEAQKILVILIGSEKGLCGAFNSSLFSYSKESINNYASHATFIGVGKKAIEFLRAQSIEHIIEYPRLQSNAISVISQQITDLITAKAQYSHVIVYSNVLKSFFVQRPATTFIVPLQHSTVATQPVIAEPYVWEEPQEKVLEGLFIQLVYAQLYYLLYTSLVAEQAARFISMDGATRNANQMIETKKLHYNKARQAQITKELAELSGNL